ncbi:hypothetical protein VL20_5599 [Microcystis panniformis FACHB-1757]|uniref:Uncharacterized protein n=1 Tax=Microcystis panniformis FACHB-1757 TaxID=1638788 RepID=A0A0K1S8V2_9CHRO|nr:hypothetical protein VL20_5599 [Microcystis panniformis FACHB-1757]
MSTVNLTVVIDSTILQAFMRKKYEKKNCNLQFFAWHFNCSWGNFRKPLF